MDARSCIRHGSWKAGCITKGACPVWKAGIGNRRQQCRTALVLDLTLYSDAPRLSVLGGDHGCRAVLSWRLSNTLHADFCVEALEEALRRFGRPEIFNTDQGSQFTSTDFTGVLKAHGIKISMDGKGRCMDNVFIERLWRSL